MVGEVNEDNEQIERVFVAVRTRTNYAPYHYLTVVLSASGRIGYVGRQSHNSGGRAMLYCAL